MYKCIITFSFEGRTFWSGMEYKDTALNGLTNKHITMNFIKVPYVSIPEDTFVNSDERNMVEDVVQTLSNSPYPPSNDSHNYGGGDFGGGGAGSSWDSSDSSSDSGSSD